ELLGLYLGGVLHDIGKIGFSDCMFSGDGQESEEKMQEEIVQHPLIGEKILKDLHFLGPVLKYVRYHHERVDGQGYPYGLRGSQIPLGARIISVTDCFDAVTTTRPYQKKRSPAEAFRILRETAGYALDKELVREFITEVQENGMED
ncbi:MAG: HD-GYP domain-containing protein, partial [Desulfonatronovibrionaceae bacterium]